MLIIGGETRKKLKQACKQNYECTEFGFKYNEYNENTLLTLQDGLESRINYNK